VMQDTLTGAISLNGAPDVSRSDEGAK
jgi:hypothetical protein